MKNWVKKVLAITLAASMLFSVGANGALAASRRDIEDESANFEVIDENTVICDGYKYELVYGDDGEFTINTYEDDSLIVTLSAKIGVDEFQLTSYASTDGRNVFSGQDSLTETQKFSDFVTIQSEAPIVQTREPLAATYTSVGRVTFQVYDGATSTTYPYLDYSKYMWNTYYGNFTLNNGMSTLVSVVLGAIVTGLGGTIPMAIATKIMLSCGATVTGSVLGKALSATVTGTVNRYSLKARHAATGRERVYDGTEILNVKTFNKTTQTTQTNTYYDGYYPSFISRKDTGPAVWTMSDFFTGYCSIYRWS